MKYPFYNSWIKWNYNNSSYGLRKDKSDICTFTADKTDTIAGTYKEELLNNARLIKDYYNGTFDVLYSGGIDSEVVLRIFKELGIKHNTIIVRYKDGYNYREIENALEFVKSFNIPHKIIDFDLQKFYEEEAYELCIKSSCIRVGRVNHIKFCVDFCDNIPVMGEGDIYWHRTHQTDYTKPKEWKFLVSEASHNCNMYLTSLGRENVCDFYEFTPNLIKAYNNQPIMKQLLNDEKKGKVSNWSSKWAMHKELWPDLKERVKLTGLEKDGPAGTMPEFVRTLQDTIEKEIGPGNDYWYTPEELKNII
jgi:hypothetical protein